MVKENNFVNKTEVYFVCTGYDHQTCSMFYHQRGKIADKFQTYKGREGGRWKKIAFFCYIVELALIG